MFENFEDIFEESYVAENEFAVTDEEMNAIGVIECFDEPEVACYRIALENEQNHNAIMSAIMQEEFQVLESTGQVMVWEASKLAKAWEWVKAQIKKFWEKVKGVFKKVMDKINSMVLTNKAFVKKYRGKEAQYTITGTAAKITGYNFPESQTLNFEAVAKAVANNKSFMENGTVKKDEFTKAARGHLVGKSPLSAEEFQKALKVKLYGSENTQSVDVKDSFKQLLDYIETYGSIKKSAKEAYKDAESAVKALLSEAKKAEKESDDEKAEAAYKGFSGCCTAAINVMSIGLSNQTKAITTKMTQYRRMANMYVTGKAEVKESADVMESVVII